MFHIYHMRRDTMWMDLFRRSYPSRYNALHFLPRVEDIVRIDRDTDEQYRNFTLVPGNVYGRLPVDKDGAAYLHFYCGEGDLMVNLPHGVIDALLEGTRDLDWLRRIASYANSLAQEAYSRQNIWCDDWEEDYDPAEEAWSDYWRCLEEFISEMSTQ